MMRSLESPSGLRRRWPLAGMSPRVLFAAVLLTLSTCAFEPDLSRFEPCNEAGECQPGFLCLTEARRCVPECGEDCPPPVDGGVDSGVDASVDAGLDAGVDAGAGMDGGDDAGTDAGTDGGADGGSDGGEDGGADAGDAGPVLSLAQMTLPAAIETRPYSVGFVPTGGEGQYFFSMDGSVPGFSLGVTSTMATLSTAAATRPGTFPFSITVQDEALPRGQATTAYSLEVRPFLRVASHVLVEGRQGQAYFQQLSATGGQPPYRWFVDGGTPPGGTALNGDAGILQGAPNTVSVVMFNVTVVDSATPQQQASRTLTVETKLLDLVVAIATVAADDGRVGTPYNQPLKAYPNGNNCTWSIQPGSASLPPGIMLTNAGSDWALTGTPLDAGAYPFSIRCTHSLGMVNQPISITVY